MRSGARPGEKRPAVVICHGFKGFQNWGFHPRLAERLATAGFAAWSFNFSGSGVGDGDQFDQPRRFENQKPSNDLADLATVVSAARGDGAPWVALVGHSRGGALAVLQAGRDPGIGALVTWAAIADFNLFGAADLARWRRDGKLDVVNARTRESLPMGIQALDDYEAHKDGALDIRRAASHVRSPWLIVHGTADESVSPSAARTLAAHSGSENTELLLIDGADHTFGIRHPWSGSTAEFDEVLERTAGFLMAALPG